MNKLHAIFEKKCIKQNNNFYYFLFDAKKYFINYLSKLRSDAGKSDNNNTL